MDARRKIVTIDEEDTEILSAFFASIVNNKTHCLQGTQMPELQDRHRGKNDNLINQGKMVSNLLHHLDTHTRVLRNLVEELTKPLSIIYQQLWLTREVPDKWRWEMGCPSTGRARRRIWGITVHSA